MKNTIKMGDRVEIMSRDNAIGKSYVSKVEQVIDESTLTVHVPIAYGYSVRLPLDTAYVFVFYTDNGMVRSEAEITDYFVEDGFQMMNIVMMSEAQKYQRREFFRFECSLPLQFGVVSDDYDIARDRPKPELFSGIAKDISAGGVCFISDHKVPQDARIKCVLPLGGDAFFTLGFVMHLQDTRNAVNRYQYRVMFMDLTSMEKDKIVKYIFTEQRKALRREK